MSKTSKIVVLKDAKEIAATAAKEFIHLANAAIRDHGFFSAAFSGGSTPKRLYETLAADTSLTWEKIHVFWGDERHVPPDHPDSNFRMTEETLLSHVSIPASNIHRIRAEEPDAGYAAQLYENDLNVFFVGPPRLDLALLGMGSDGHTASLFPGTKALRETDRLVVSNWVGKLYSNRITLTAPVLNQATCVLFLVSGADKASALKGVHEGPFEPDQLPAQLISPVSGKLLWLVDQAAARLLDKIEN